MIPSRLYGHLDLVCWASKQVEVSELGMHLRIGEKFEWGELLAVMLG
jgi:hypothetical protein